MGNSPPSRMRAAVSPAFPVVGEGEQTQETAATDMMTLTGAGSQSGDFIVLRNSAKTELFVLGSSAVITQSVTQTGSAALAAHDITVADNTTYASGYGAATYWRVTQGGEKTGTVNGSQFNALALDLTLTAGCPYVCCSYMYVAQSGATLTSTDVMGHVVFVSELGATRNIITLSLEKANTTKATNFDAFIKMACQGSGVTKTGLYFTGSANPDYFIQTQTVTDCFSVDAGTTGNNSTHKIKIKLGSTDGYLAVFADY